MTLIFGRERLLSSGCVQVHDLTIIEYSSIGYIDNSDFLFGLRFKLCTCIETYQLTMVIRGQFHQRVYDVFLS